MCHDKLIIPASVGPLILFPVPSTLTTPLRSGANSFTYLFKHSLNCVNTFPCINQHLPAAKHLIPYLFKGLPAFPKNPEYISFIQMFEINLHKEARTGNN